MPLWRLKEDLQETIEYWKHHEDLVGELPFHCLGNDTINNRLFLDLFRTCNTYNIGMDSHAGFHSMESRAPYLRQKLVLGMLNCDGRKKIRIMSEVEKHLKHKQHMKYYLRKLFYNQLPRSVTHKHAKAGFCTPYGDVLKPKNIREDESEMVRDVRKYITLSNGYYHG